MSDPRKIFLLQIIAHLSLLAVIIFGSWYDYIAVLIVYFITGCFGVTMTYHRLLAHKSWNAPQWWRYFGSLSGIWGIVGSPIAWVATHRAHHRYTDDMHDPHSPQYKPWWKIQWLSMFQPVPVKYSVDLLRDPFQTFIHRHYFTIHAGIIISLLIISPWLLLVIYFAPAALLWNAGSAINTITHKFGYRNHETKDNSRCNLFLGYFVFGEGWHNNHHALPASPTFKSKWWEFDIGHFFIRLFQTRRETV